MLKKVFRENWLTRAPSRNALGPTALLAALLVFGKLFEHPATADRVYDHHEYWRAWTTLFVHAGPEHLLANLFLFVPFAYVLVGYFSPLFFPLAGFFVGGLVNLAVLKTLPPGTALIGVSGVVYWMGAAWITLGLRIDRREKLSIRIVKAMGVSMLLFLPERYQPEVSYLTHALGYVGGIASALVYYAIARRSFLRAEKYDYRYDFDLHWNPKTNGYTEELPEDLSIRES